MLRLPGRPRKFPGGILEALLDHARGAFALARPVGEESDSQSLEDHLRQFAFSKGLDEDEYIAEQAPDCPREAEYLYQLFLELHRDREYGASGPRQLSSRDIFFWQAVNGIELRPSEIAIVRQLDSVWREVVVDAGSSRTGTEG